MNPLDNPMVKEIAASFVKWALAGLFGYLLKQGVLSNDQVTYLTGAAVTGLLALAWMIRERYKSRNKLMTALAQTAPTSEAHLEQLAKSPAAPPVNLPKDRIPYMAGEKPPVDAPYTKTAEGETAA
jgi:hypothetical protein